jgi:hypothetical protein
MKTRKTTVTITFTLSHTLEDDQTDLNAVRGIIAQIRDDTDTPMQVYVNEDTNRFEFVGGQSTRYAGRMFSFTTVGEFVKKFAKEGSYDLLTVLRDYCTFVSCKATTVTEKKEGEHADR